MNNSKKIHTTSRHTFDRASHNTSRFVQIGAFSLALVLMILILHVNRKFYHDDAYITLRYVHNFLNGNGIAWNPGEYVQGYTNFFYLILITILGRFGVDLFVASRIIGLSAFFTLVILLICYQHLSRLKGRPHPLDTIPVVLVCASCPMIVWALGGLEGTLFSLLCIAGVLLFLAALPPSEYQSPHRLLFSSGVCFSLASLTRPDGLIFLCISLIWLLLCSRNGGRRGARVFVAPCLFILVPYVLWQVSYYGDIVPNPFYVKASGLSVTRIEEGIRYVLRYASSPPYLLLLAILAALYGLIKRTIETRVIYLILLALAYLIFIVYVGGDHMQSFRLMIPMIPILSYAIYLIMKNEIRHSDVTGILVVYMVTITLLATQLFSFTLNPKGEDPASRVGTIVGKYISLHWRDNSLVALNTAGSTPYYAPNHRYIDMLGLNDRYIARRHIQRYVLPFQKLPGHSKGDGAYVLSRCPDFIIVGPAEGTVINRPWFLSDLEMFLDRRFSENYRMRQVTIDQTGQPTNSGSLIFTYYQRTEKPCR